MEEAAVPVPRRTALWVAASMGDVEEAMQLLADGAGVDEKGALLKCTPLMIATKRGHEETVLLLLEHGADASVIDFQHCTPLHDTPNEAIALLLLQHGADVSATDGSGLTPLHKAALEGHAEVAKVLLEHGADVSARRGSGAMPLQDAIDCKNEAVVEVLLEHGADVNGTDTSAEDGWTMLHLAAFKGLAEVVKLLLQHGANILAVNNARQTARFVAAFQSHHEVVAILQEATVTRAKCVAFAMGHHKRLGVGSLVAPLDAEVVRMVLQLVV
jgi:ankyrin repeat protein